MLECLKGLTGCNAGCITTYKMEPGEIHASTKQVAPQSLTAHRQGSLAHLYASMSALNAMESGRSPNTCSPWKALSAADVSPTLACADTSAVNVRMSGRQRAACMLSNNCWALWERPACMGHSMEG